MVHCWGRPLSNLQLEFVGERAGSWFRGQRQRNFLFKKSTLFAKKPLSLVANLRSAFNIMRVYWVEEGDCPPPSLLDWGEGHRTDWGDTLVFPQKFNFFRSSAFALIFFWAKNAQNVVQPSITQHLTPGKKTVTWTMHCSGGGVTPPLLLDWRGLVSPTCPSRPERS